MAIPRQRGEPALIPTAGGRADPAALRRDLDLTLVAVAKIQSRLNLVDDRLAKRVNEMLLSGLLADRPTPGIQDRLFFTLDTGDTYYDDGRVWRLLASGGGLVAQSGYVTFVAGVTTVPVVFGVAEPAPNYRLTLGLGVGLGAPGLTSYGWANKTIHGFDFQIGVAPAVGTSYIGDWTASR